MLYKLILKHYINKTFKKMLKYTVTGIEDLTTDICIVFLEMNPTPASTVGSLLMVKAFEVGYIIACTHVQ